MSLPSLLVNSKETKQLPPVCVLSDRRIHSHTHTRVERKGEVVEAQAPHQKKNGVETKKLFERNRRTGKKRKENNAKQNSKPRLTPP